MADGQAFPVYHALEDFFNKRFEFYGRKIRIIQFGTVEWDGSRAAAQGAREQHKAFATTDNDDAFNEYYDEAARLGIVSSIARSPFPEPYLRARRPYLWQYAMANDRIFATAGNWYCARFAGRNAVHAGDALLQRSRRKPGIIFGVAQSWIAGTGTSPDPMNAQLAACGKQADVVYTDGLDPVGAENAVLQMKTSGVTTIACLCDRYALVAASHAATNQAYFPEWIITTYLWADYNRFWCGPGCDMSSVQAGSMMGLSMQPMQRSASDMPVYWANPELNRGAVHYGKAEIYRSLLLLASGIQMAGPHLTPETFERALHRTRFPNPPHRIMAGSVGFNDGDYSMTDDAAEIWWSNAEPSPYPGDHPGAFCYVDGGARRRAGAFPTDDPFFAGPCDSGST